MLALRTPARPRAHAPTTLQVALLGTPVLRAAEQPITLPRRQSRALFFRIAAAAPQPVAREHLCFLLWPDLPEALARRNLTVLLTQLRRTLPVPDALVTDGDAMALNAQVGHTDTAQFVAATRHAALDALAAATHSYRGPFLDGFVLPASPEFDAWADQERQLWERRYLDALALLVEGYAAQQAYAPAIAAAQRALAVDELAETMHRRLIALHAASGDRPAALRQFERCVVVLERELGVSPLPETRAVYAAVRDGASENRAIVRRGDEETRSRSTRKSSNLLFSPAPLLPCSPPLLPPAPPTPLLGRAEELTQISAMLRDPAVRLLTLCGPGGSGKTRLAQQLAADVSNNFADGAIWVSLAAVRDPALVLGAIARACAVPQPNADALAVYLRPKHMLLVLDNCEHLLLAGSDIAALLAAAPHLHILATSRSALRVQGEHTRFVPPLPLPNLAQLPPLETLAAVPSVALLLARTQALNPRFTLTSDNAADLAAICVRLDGLPLALELAAARLRLLAPRDLLRRLDRRLTLLIHGARDLPERQQTLRATIDWSYRLLDTNEQVWFERCSVFVGGWTLAAVEALHENVRLSGQSTAAPLDALAALIDKSLVQVAPDDAGEPRFSMLETIREFAAERLRERGTFDMVAQAHADAFLERVEPWDNNAPEWLATIERDLDNLRAALRWYFDHDDQIEAALRLGAVLGRFWYWRDWITEGRWWLEQLVARSEGQHTETRARVLSAAALLATVQGDAAHAIELNETNLRLSQALHLLLPRANALNALGTIYARQGNFARALAYLEDGLDVARQLDKPDTLCTAYYMLAGVLIDEGREIARARTLYETCLSIARQHQLVIVESMTLAALGVVYAMTGNTARAAELLPEALRLQRETNATMSIGWTLQFLGILAYQQANYADAMQYFLESLDAAPHGGANYIAPLSLEGIAGVLSMHAQPERAVLLLGAADALRERLDAPRPPIEYALYDRILTSVRAQLSEAILRATWDAGRKLTLEQALAEAKTLPT